MTTMKSAIPKSLVRTASTGEINVYLVLEVKATKELLVVSRQELPPALRLGKLTLNQKVTFRDENRQNVESSIVYMHADQQVCQIAKQQILQMKKRTNENINDDPKVETTNSSSVDKSSTTSGNINKKSRNTSAKKSTQCVKQKATAEKEPSAATTNALPFIESQPTDASTIGDLSSDFDEDVGFLSNSVQENEEDEPDRLLQEVQKLTLKVKNQEQMIKERDAEIKRLKLTTINMPTDENARDYITHLANRIRISASGYKYTGNLINDAKKMGLKVEELKQSLDGKNPISTTARYLFKKIVPPSDRQVDHWNKLSPDVLMKEKILLDFLERYFGPLEVDQKKLHTSLVGCLRNQRGLEKKQKQETSINEDGSVEYNLFEIA